MLFIKRRSPVDYVRVMLLSEQPKITINGGTWTYDAAAHRASGSVAGDLSAAGSSLPPG
jgi:hypothetical protein